MALEDGGCVMYGHMHDVRTHAYITQHPSVRDISTCMHAMLLLGTIPGAILIF